MEPLWTRWWEKNHGNQEKGARGEIAAGKELEKLHSEGFHIFHDYKPENFGNVDHFLIGDKGVFVIETKAWSGEISTDGYDILVNGRRSRYSPISQAKSEATRVRHLLQKSGGIDIRVRSILCFTGDELRIYGKVRGVEVTSLGALRRSVMQLSVEIPDEERLNQSTVRVLSQRLSQHLSERPAASPGNLPEPPGKMKKRLKADKIFVAVYITSIFALTLIFAGDTAVILDNVANLYRAIYLLSSNP
ncbi:MAG: nuclease-related domain-containing protein [Rubrobacter sp.]